LQLRLPRPGGKAGESREEQPVRSKRAPISSHRSIQRPGTREPVKGPHRRPSA